jgi:hypothetical protein
MDGALCQLRAVNAVLGISGYPPDHVTRVDILEFQVKRPVPEISLDTRFEQRTDVLEEDITRKVGLSGRIEPFLASSLRARVS